jgi:hypothetical protein
LLYQEKYGNPGSGLVGKPLEDDFVAQLSLRNRHRLKKIISTVWINFVNLHFDRKHTFRINSSSKFGHFKTKPRYKFIIILRILWF